MTDNEALALKIGIGVLVLGGAGTGAYFIWKGRQARAQLGMGQTTPPLGVSPTATETSSQHLADGTVRKVWSDGSSTSEHPDGTIEATSSTGSKVTQHTDGTVAATSSTGAAVAPPTRPQVTGADSPLPSGIGGATVSNTPAAVVTSGPTYDECLSQGHRWSPGHGCQETYYNDQHINPTTLIVRDRERIRDVQRRLLAYGYFTGSHPTNVVDGSVGPLTSAAILRFQQATNTTQGFVPGQNYLPDGSDSQSRIPYLPLTGTLDSMTEGVILQQLAT